MIIKVLIRTPKGQAKKAEKKLRLFIIGFHKNFEMYTNDLDNEICWIITGDVRRISKIAEKVGNYNSMVHMVLNNKLAKKVVKKRLSAEGQEELLDMLINSTSVDIIKYEEEIELEKKKESVFYKIKKLFKK